MAKILLESVKVDKAGNGHFTAIEVCFLPALSVHLRSKPSVDFLTGLERKWTDRAGKEHTSIEVHVNEAQATKLSGNDPF